MKSLMMDLTQFKAFLAGPTPQAGIGWELIQPVSLRLRDKLAWNKLPGRS